MDISQLLYNSNDVTVISIATFARKDYPRSFVKFEKPNSPEELVKYIVSELRGRKPNIKFTDFNGYRSEKANEYFIIVEFHSEEIPETYEFKVFIPKRFRLEEWSDPIRTIFDVKTKKCTYIK